MNHQNPFELFGLPVRPAIDAGPLKARLHELGKSDPPDQAPDEESRRNREDRWKRINEAYRILSDDVLRLKCLLQLHEVNDPNASAQIPGGVTELFTDIGPLLNQCKEHLKQMEAADSGLERAMLQADGFELSTRLQKVAARVGQAQAALQSRMNELDATWASSPDLDGLLDCYRQLVYIDRWARQIDECQFRLMNG